MKLAIHHIQSTQLIYEATRFPACYMGGIKVDGPRYRKGTDTSGNNYQEVFVVEFKLWSMHTRGRVWLLYDIPAQWRWKAKFDVRLCLAINSSTQLPLTGEKCDSWRMNTCPCPNECSNNGACDGDGICECNYAWTGEDCSVKRLV